nr:elongation factor P maturation arginine rhamnosyltransferase EarP [Candidatus Gracilibacteria bacterium]
MNSSIDFYVPIIDNYGDIGFALNLALNMTSESKNLKVRFFSDNEELFNKMIGDNGKEKITFLNINELNNHIPSKNIFTFFDYRLSNDYLKKGETNKTIIQFGYFLLHKGVENLHGTTYEINGDKYIHFIPSLIKNTGGIIINKIKTRGDIKENYLNYINKKYNLKLSKNLANNKWVSVFVYKDSLSEILKSIKHRNDEVFFIFDYENNYKSESNNLFFMPFLELLDFNELLSICDINFVRGENSLCTSLAYGKPTLWDIYKEKNGAHNEKLDDFLKFVGDFGINLDILRFFNSSQKNEAINSFLDKQDFHNLFKFLGNYIEQNCNLLTELKKILKINF